MPFRQMDEAADHRLPGRLPMRMQQASMQGFMSISTHVKMGISAN
jgi:hypothetical protein